MAGTRTDLTAQLLRAQFYYSPELGLFFRRFAAGGQPPWAPAGYRVSKGYWQVKIGGVAYRRCRLAWLYVTGEWPSEQIDHKNRDKGDDRFDNLRDVPQSENKLNTPMYRNNKSGFRGVSWYANSGKWLAQITRGGKRKHIGYFSTPEAAHAAFVAAGGTSQ